MIDTESERVFPLTRAGHELGITRRRSGVDQSPKRIHKGTWYRWSTRGCRGIVLESVQIGATRCTSREAISRFFDALTRKSQGVIPPVQAATDGPERSPIAPTTAYLRAERELDRLGV